ncbi:unnamed protein product [Dimorphilus gyrociliatus]|uniref:Uncharacterized protein n=1 Tax=Dimorphilus gyrociliatus TaxID=2664684 RepID=A0A7I8W9N9_9ANNE|nr:unnamed protein product [Dimorphilus gyrociliatus]
MNSFISFLCFYIIINVHLREGKCQLNAYQSNIEPYARLLDNFHTNIKTYMKGFNRSSRHLNHPFLFFNVTDVRHLQKSIKSTHKVIFHKLEKAAQRIINNSKVYLPPANIRKFGSEWNEDYGNNLIDLAFYCLLKPNGKAIAFTKTFIRLMNNIPSWRYTKQLSNDFPIANNMLGFTLAVDFLWNSLTTDERTVYINRIFNTLKEINVNMNKKPWGNDLIQSNSTANIVSVFVTSLFLEKHKPSVRQWRLDCMKKMEYSIKLLEGIGDGTNGESVSSNSLFTKSLTQYIFLINRHFQFKHHFTNRWLRNQLNLFYHTTLPSRDRTICIGDSQLSWLYGPEAQLLFIDTFAMKNGQGTFMAGLIRSERSHSRYLRDRLGTIFTELLWFDPVLTSKRVSTQIPNHHIFQDWGVSTYRSHSFFNRHATHISFKASPPHGHLVSGLANGRINWWSGWSHFRPLYEHPNQNSLAIVMNNKTFISHGGFHQNKLTYFENTLVFKYEKGSKKFPPRSCTFPWIGQLGECGHFFNFNEKDVVFSQASIVVSRMLKNFVFTSGEAAGAYPKSLGIKRYYRSMITLHPQLILLVDYLGIVNSKVVKHFSAFFNNYEYSFYHSRVLRYNAAHMKNKDKYVFYWHSSDGQSPMPTFRTGKSPYENGKPFSNVNITFSINNLSNYVLYGFLGPSITISKSEIRVGINEIKIQIESNVGKYVIQIPVHYQRTKYYCAITKYGNATVLFSKPIKDNNVKKVAPKHSISANNKHQRVTRRSNVRTTTIAWKLSKRLASRQQKKRRRERRLKKRNVTNAAIKSSKCSILLRYTKMILLVTVLIGFYSSFHCKLKRRCTIYKIAILLVCILVTVYLSSEGASCLINFNIYFR